jgi:hypothetical protein
MDHSSQGRLQTFYLMVGRSATPSLDFFPIKGMERGLIWIEVQLRYPSRD